VAKAGGRRISDGGKARRVFALLGNDIVNGRLPSGTGLPGEQHLAGMHGVSRVAIRRALASLAGDGLIEQWVGTGSVVRGSTRQTAGPRRTCRR
jgi:GntR family transcriptional regulator